MIAVFLFVFSSNTTARILAIVFQSIFVLFSGYLVMITREYSVITFVGSYGDFLGIILYAYNASAIFILLTTILFLAVSVYSFHEVNQRTFWFLLFLLEASLVGLFLTRDLFNIFVMIEVSTVVVIILLMYYRERRQMFTGMVYLMVNIISMQFYLFGLAYIYMIGGGFDFIHLTEVFSYTDRNDLALPYALIMTGLAFKAGIIPLFSIVPKARLYPGAPSAVAALLSGIHVKTAVYLFMRFQEVFGHVSHHEFFVVVGIITGVTGVVLAIAQTDIKMILAYHTVSQVGLIIIGLSTAGEYSNLGGLYHIIGHGIFKSTLFLTAGIIRHSYGTTDVYKIRGVFKRMPLVGIATAFAILGIMGAPFFIGSISKYFLTYDVHWLVEWSVILISLGTIISFIKYGSMLFGYSNLFGDSKKADNWRLVPSFALGTLCLIGGIFGAQLINFMFGANISIDLMGYLQKSMIFFVSLAAGFVIYKFVVQGNTTLKYIGGLDFGFKSICVSMGVFFGILLIMVGVNPSF